MWRVLIHPKAKKFLDKLETPIKKRLKEKIKALKANPFEILEHYEGDYYKLRIGAYRCLIDVEFKQKIVLIRVIGHRKNIYKS